MLTILSANENLLERLELLTQNTPRPIDAGPEKPARAHTVLLNGSAMAAKGLPVQLPKEVEDETIDDELEEPAAARSLQHRCCTKWMLLMAKKGFDEHQITLQTLADLFRLSLAMSGTVSNNNEDEPSMRILILKKERAEEDEEHLRAHMDAVRREWSEQWGSQQADKLRRFGESDARREQLDRTKQWMEHTEPGNLCCALAYFDDPNLMKTINKFFQLGDTGFDIVESADEECGDEKRQHQLFTKPPALHWTNYPREAEVQVTFKFTFPKGTVPEWLFRHWIRKGKQLLVWDYEYEWTNGILLRADELVKITITRAASEPHVLEVSGRIDTDEAAEEEDQEREDRSKEETDENDEVEVAEEGEGENATARVEEANGGDLPSPPDSSGHSAPLQKVWPYLVRIFQQIVADIENRKTLPFCLSLVFIGELFFKCPEGVQKLGARSLDAIQTLSSIQRIKAVRFRADQEQIFALDLDQCFPNFRPTRLADFSADKLPLPTPKLSVATSGSSSPSEVPTAATSLGGSAILVPTAGSLQSPKKARVDRSPSCVPAFALAHGDEARLSPTSSIRKQQNNNGNSSSTGSPVDQPKQPSSPQLGAQSLHVERQLGGYKNRGRRVSFGVIHSIPSQGEPGHSGRSSPGGASSPLLMSISSSNRFSISPEPGQKQKQEQQQADENVENGTSDKNEEDAKKDENDEQENREQKHHRKQSAEDNGGESALVENIVDEMLQKAIDEVLVIAE